MNVLCVTKPIDMQFKQYRGNAAVGSNWVKRIEKLKECSDPRAAKLISELVYRMAIITGFIK